MPAIKPIKPDKPRPPALPVDQQSVAKPVATRLAKIEILMISIAPGVLHVKSLKKYLGCLGMYRLEVGVNGW